MCGIVGIISKNGKTPDRALLESMTYALQHRGPDDQGFFLDGNVGLGFQRLSIIDLEGGHQPMSDPEKKIWIIFNGEIYNFQYLKILLEETGRHQFRTKSDTEVILHLYQEYGEECVQHLRGMFAFAIWDTIQQKLFIARDRLGEKPLIYADLPDAFIFASEIQSLTKHPSIKKKLSVIALDLYLTYQYIPSPHTIFTQINKLPSAHSLTWHDKKIAIKRYWDLSFLPGEDIQEEGSGVKLIQELKEATRLRMISDVPVGAFLSGGIDSSTIVGLMSELSAKPIKTFSIGFEEKNYSELAYAKLVAHHFGCDHHELILKPEKIDLLPKLAKHYGEPFADSSALASYCVSEFTKKYVTVALTGDGGDETMAGYPRYQAMHFFDIWKKLPYKIRHSIYKIISLFPDGHPPLSIIWRLKRLLNIGLANLNPAHVYLDTLYYFSERQKRKLYTDELCSQLNDYDAAYYLDPFLTKGSLSPGVSRYLLTDLFTYIPECLMVKMDIASMSNSLETRSPFLDHKFIEFTSSLPSNFKLRGFKTKYLLKKKLTGWLPQSTLKHRKQGFSLPMSHWFKDDLSDYIHEILFSPQSLSRQIFKKDSLKSMLKEHDQGVTNLSYQIWSLLMLEQWYQISDM